MNDSELHAIGKRAQVGFMAFICMVALSAWAPRDGLAADSSTVVIGYENLGATPEMVVLTKGWFQKYMHGHVILKEFASGPAALTAIASGALEFMTEIGNPPVAAAISRGVKLDVIWNDETFTTGEGLVARKQSGIRSLADLIGKRVGVVSGSSSDYVLTEALARANVARSKIRLINISPPGMLSAWQSGSLDAVFVWTPVINQLAAHDGRIVFVDANAVGYAPSVNLSVVNSDWAKAHPDQVIAFLRAQNEGVAYTRSHPAEALKIMATGAGISEELARVELSGIQFFDAREQLTEQGLGAPGGSSANSTVGRALDGALSFLKDAGLASGSSSASPSSSVVRKYVQKLSPGT